MSRNFEINIMLRVSCSQDAVDQHLQGGLRLVQSKISDEVVDLLPKMYKDQKNAPSFHCENILVTVEGTS